MIFKMYNCDFGLKYNDVNYDFDHVESMTVEDPRNVKLIRGSNAKNKEGLIYTEGTKEALKITVTLIGISAAMYNLIAGIVEAKSRVEFYCVDRVSGSSRVAKSAIITQQARQNTVDESPESMNVVLTLESYDLVEVHKE